MTAKIEVFVHKNETFFVEDEAGDGGKEGGGSGGGSFTKPENLNPNDMDNGLPEWTIDKISIMWFKSGQALWCDIYVVFFEFALAVTRIVLKCTPDLWQSLFIVIIVSTCYKHNLLSMICLNTYLQLKNV